MIIWNGLIANAFLNYKDNNDIIIFASWVSNSKNQDDNLFKREIDLIKETLKLNYNKLFIYFSSCSITDETLWNSKYINHKINAENIIKNNKNNNFLIIRIPNVVWYTNNPNTLINYLINNIKNWNKFILYKNAKRNIIDVEDLFKISEYIIDKKLFLNSIINIANNKNETILNIVNCIEEVLLYKAYYIISDRGWEPKIDIENIENIIKEIWIDFWNWYLLKIIKKYYL